MHLTGTTEATFVAGGHGRDGVLALWEDPAEVPGAVERAGSVTIGFPDGPRPVPADLVPVGAAIGPLATLPAGDAVTASVRAWSVATRLALDLVARGRLVPAMADDGADTWRVGPLTARDRSLIEALADALPAPAHAVPVAQQPDHIVDAHRAVVSYLDATADAFARTAAAPIACGADAFAHRSPVEVTVVERWLRTVVAGAAGDTQVGLRIELADDPDDDVRAVIQVQSRHDPSLVLDAVDLWQASAAVLSRFGPEVEADILLALRGGARAWPPVERLLSESTPTELVLADAEVEDLFGPIADDLASAGLPVLWPAEVFRPIELTPVLEPAGDDARPDDGRPAEVRLDLATLGELRWAATIDGESLTEAELEELAEAKRPVVRLRGNWVRADPARLRQLNDRAPLRAGEAMAAALTGTVSVAGTAIPVRIHPTIEQLAAGIRHHRSDAVIEPPVGLEATLRPYQQRGLAWLVEMAELGLGGVLADDMGLGKTIQVLALHLLRRGRGPALVVCPASVLGNWEREAHRFTPAIPVRRYHGPGRSLEDLADDEIVLATYGIVRRDAPAIAAAGPWSMVIADEAQAVKNASSHTAQALRAIPAPARFALTGTPVENRLSDLWALLDWTTPGLLGTESTFQRELATPIERDRDESRTSWLASLVRPFLLRRRKIDPDIAPELPPKTETDQFVGLTVEQATLYRATVTELLAEVSEAEGISRKGRVLKLLTALKQICNHPAQYLGQQGPIPGRSAKVDAVTELVDTILAEDESVLLFTQYVAMGTLLESFFQDRGVPTQFLHGGTPIPAREQMVDHFQGAGPMAFVISLKAGGTGLNLTRATHVIHVDRWWNPAVEDQASDRAWRIGQDRPVQVHRMVCEGTLEERIAALLEQKRALSDAVVQGGEAWVSELSDDELATLVMLDRDAGAW